MPGRRRAATTGGVATLREAFLGRHIDDAHFAVAPVLLGRGEAVSHGLDLPGLGYRITRRVSGEGADHLFIARD